MEWVHRWESFTRWCLQGGRIDLAPCRLAQAGTQWGGGGHWGRVPGAKQAWWGKGSAGKMWGCAAVIGRWSVMGQGSGESQVGLAGDEGGMGEDGGAKEGEGAGAGAPGVS